MNDPLTEFIKQQAAARYNILVKFQYRVGPKGGYWVYYVEHISGIYNYKKNSLCVQSRSQTRCRQYLHNELVKLFKTYNFRIDNNTDLLSNNNNQKEGSDEDNDTEQYYDAEIANNIDNLKIKNEGSDDEVVYRRDTNNHKVSNGKPVSFAEYYKTINHSESFCCSNHTMKTEINNYFQKTGKSKPSFIIKSEKGPPHNKTIQVSVSSKDSDFNNVDSGEFKNQINGEVCLCKHFYDWLKITKQWKF